MGKKNCDNNDISIALCTYNGADFLQEQLNSLLNQTCKPKEIIISDDGSTDETLGVIERFREKTTLPVYIIKNEEKLGPVQNFSRAMMACAGRYIALCDQDDVWKENKLEVTLNKMKEMEKCESPNCPLLIHGDLIVTDDRLNPITTSMMRKQGLNNEDDMQQARRVLVTQNYVTGCTVMINRKLRDIACPIPQEAVMHDWWLALIAAHKGKIGFINEPLIYYRQHSSNTVGAVINSARRYFKAILHPHTIRDKLLAVLVQALVAKECKLAQSFVENIINHDIGGVWKLGIHRQKMIENIGLYFMLWHYNEYYSDKLKAYIKG